MQKVFKMLPIEDQIEILKEAILSVTVATEEEAKNEATEVILYLQRQGLEINYMQSSHSLMRCLYKELSRNNYSAHFIFS